jgi:hypothetical protein
MLILAAIPGVLVYGVVAATCGRLSPTLGFNDVQNAATTFAQAIGLAIASVSAGPLIDVQGCHVAGLALIWASLAFLPSAGNDYTAVIVSLTVLGFGAGVR